jgi:hypothetical protein
MAQELELSKDMHIFGHCYDTQQASSSLNLFKPMILKFHRPECAINLATWVLDFSKANDEK